MATIYWTTLFSVEEWAEVLAQLLKESEESVKNDDSGKRDDVKEQLDEFVKESPSRCTFLDEIARKTARNLYLQQVEKSIAAIAANNAELRQAIKLIKGVTEEAKKDKKALMFEKVIDGLNKATEALEQIKESKDIDLGDTGDLFSKDFDDINDAIEQLKDKILKSDSKT